MRHPHHLKVRGGLYSGLTSASKQAQDDYSHGISYSAAGRHRKHYGGIGAEGVEMGLEVGKHVVDLIPGGSEFLQQVGLEAPPPPPPPTASFHAMTGFQAPLEATRQHVRGRGKKSTSIHKMKVHHACPHCGGVHAAMSTTRKHKCKHCGGSFLSALSSGLSKAVSVGKKVAANPMFQKAVQLAAPHVMAYAQQHAPGLVSAAQKYAPIVQAAYQHPVGQMAAKHLGFGKHKVHHSCPHCGGAKHSAMSSKNHKCKHCGGAWWNDLADTVKKVAAHPLAQQLYHHAAPHIQHAVQQHAPGLATAVGHMKAAYQHPLGQMAAKHLGLGKRRSRPPTAHSLAVGKVMKETGMGLGHASRYVKQHGLAH